MTTQTAEAAGAAGAAPARSAFRPDIEGLRAIAVCLVIANHVVGWPRGGFVGVDVFFVISGFLITGLLLREHEITGRISLRTFYARRARRILPMAVLVNVVTCILGFAVFFPPRALQILWDGFASLLMVQNWHLIRTSTGYFDADGSTSPLQHYWSLAVEEQFYVFWAAVLVLLLGVRVRVRVRAGGPAGLSSRRRLLVVVTLVATATSFGIACFETVDRAGWSYFSLESRAWELGVGALVAVAAPRLRRLLEGRSALGRRAVQGRRVTLGSSVGAVLVGVGLTLLGASAFALSGASTFPGPDALLPVAATACILVSGLHGSVAGSRALTNPVARYLGRISFSLYLWHLPVFIVLRACVPAGGAAGAATREAAVAAVALALTLALSALSYRFVEVPFRRARRDRPASAGRPAHPARPDRSARPDHPARPAPVANGPEDARPGPERRWTTVGVVALVLLASLQLEGPGWVAGPTPTPVAPVASGSASGSDPFGGLPFGTAPFGTAPFATDAAVAAAVSSAARASSWPALSPGPATVSSADAAAFALQRSGCLVDPLGSTAVSLAAAARRCTFGAANVAGFSSATGGAAAAAGAGTRGATSGGGARPPGPSVVVFGDSIATSWLPAVIDGLVPRGWTVTAIGLESCPAADVSVRDRVDRQGFTVACNRARADSLRIIERLHPTLVLLSSALGDYEGTLAPPSTSLEDAWTSGTHRTAARLVASGATPAASPRVVVLQSPPESVAPADCAVRVAGPATCLATPSATWTAKSRAERRATAGALGVGATRIRYLSTERWFCTAAGRCPAFVGTSLVKADTGHLTTLYARRLSMVLVHALGGAVGG